MTNAFKIFSPSLLIVLFLKSHSNTEKIWRKYNNYDLMSHNKNVIPRDILIRAIILLKPFNLVICLLRNNPVEIIQLQYFHHSTINYRWNKWKYITIQ